MRGKKFTEEDLKKRMAVHGYTYVSHKRVPFGKKTCTIVSYLCRCGNPEPVTTNMKSINKTCEKCPTRTAKISDEIIKAKVVADGHTYISHTRESRHDKTRIIVCYLCKCGNADEVKRYWEKTHQSCTKCKVDNTKATCIAKFGSECVLQNPKVLEKAKATMVERYGCEYPFQIPEVIEKVKATNMERYGYEHAIQNPEVLKKVKATNMERYGYECSLQNPEVCEKVKATNMERFGYENAIQNPEVLKKVKATNMERYGYECSLQNPEVCEKIKATNLERYGYEHAVQNPEVFAKSQANSFQTKQYTFPSGRVVSYQGYESMAYEALMYAYDIPEDDILVESDIRIRLPRFEYMMDRTLHVYNPDIFIWSQQKVIEVKSTYTASLNPEKLELKKNNPF
jgi:hypothetical protein